MGDLNHPVRLPLTTADAASIAASLTSDSTSLDILQAAIGGGGAGAVTLKDLGVISAADLDAGPITLYTPAVGELVGPVIIEIDDDFAFLGGGGSLLLTREEGDPPLAGFDTDLSRDGYSVMSGEDNKLIVTTRGPIVATFGKAGVSGVNTAAQARTTWAASTAFAETTPTIIAAGHFWTGNAGTTGLTEPDWAANFGGSVVDNDMEWFDAGVVAGSAHFLVYVQTPV